MERRNLSIMFTDMKGFTLRTSSQSRDETLQMIKRHKEILLPVITGRGGKLIKTIGDAFLVVFESPTDAVLAGLALQATLGRHNAAAAKQEQIEVRVAVNSGEVILEEGDVYGEAVNIASRVQSVSEPNQVYFTEATYLSMNKSEVPSSEIGYRILKGLPQKIKLYKALKENSASKESDAAHGADAVTAIAPTWRRAAAFAADAALITLVVAVFFASPFKQQAAKNRELRAASETWTAQAPKTENYAAQDLKQGITALKSDLEKGRAALGAKRRELEAAQIELEEKRKMLERDEELLNQKSEKTENADTNEALIHEDTELKKRGNVLDKEQDELEHRGTALDTEEENLSATEQTLNDKTDQLAEREEQGAEEVKAIAPETVKTMLWGSGPVPEEFPRHDEIMEFRSRRTAIEAGDKKLRAAGLIFWAVLFLIYHTVFFARFAGTPGKALFKLRICSEDGGRPGPARSFFRSLFYFASALPLGLGFFWVKFDAKHRAWHDKLTGTKTIPA